MKRLLCFILTAVLVLTPATIASAKQDNTNKGKQQTQQNVKIKEKKQSFKINGSSVIKYGKYKLPISPITKGMGAKVDWKKDTAVLTVTKGTTVIVIDFINKTSTINGVADTKSGIFTAKNNKKSTVLIQYIAKALGVKVTVDEDSVDVITPGLDYPTNVTVTPVGDSIVVNTLNSTTLYLNATATVKAGQATGGKAELYVGTKLVATDSAIAAADTSVTFTTSDGTPTNEELKTAVPEGGVVTVKLYNASNQSVTSVTANPTLTVDYIVPTITGVTGAALSVSAKTVSVAVTGSSIVADKVDVTKVSLYDTALNKTYTLVDSTGYVKDANTLFINLGTADQVGLAGFGTSTVFLNVNSGSLIIDAAGNGSAGFTSVISVPVTVLP